MFISGLMIAWTLSLSSNCQFNLENTYQYKMDIYTQTILPVELRLINCLKLTKGRKISENCRVLKLFLAGSKGLMLGILCIFSSCLYFQNKKLYFRMKMHDCSRLKNLTMAWLSFTN